MYTLNNIKEIKDDYLIQNVNCLEKPIGIVLNGYNSQYRFLFLMFLKMIESYNIRYYYDNDVLQMHSMNRARCVLKREFSINLYCEGKFYDLHKFIEKNIDNNNPVLLVGNLKELYYSQYYKKENWIHSFIIKGYNRENKVYYIMDSLQRGNDSSYNYYDFVIPYYIVEDMYRSLNENIYKEGVFYFKSEEIDANVNHKMLIEKCLKILIEQVCEQPYVEIDIVNKLLTNKNINVREYEKLLNITHYKEVFYNELKNALSQYIMDSTLYEQFIKLKDELIKESLMINNKVIYYIYKNNKEKALMELYKMKDKEKEMMELLKKIRTKLSNIKNLDKVSEDSKITYENNEDNIIKNVSDGVYVFNFNNNKIYNSWIKDNSPKIVWRNLHKKELIVRTKIKLLNYENGTKFFAGIFAKTEDNSLYYWGINSALSLTLENTGVNPSIIEVPKCSDEVLLKIKIMKGRWYLEYSLDGGEHMNHVEEYVLISSGIQELGIGCKTWSSAQKVSFVVTDFEISDEI